MSTHPRDIPELPHAEPDERDGIAEEDNKIPLWFNASWIATWIFGFVYIAWYLGPSDWTQVGQYRAEVAAAEARQAEVMASLPSTNPYRGDAEAIAAGEVVYTSTCVACHLPNGVGLVGPSLVDPYWKYGDSDAALFETIAKGRPAGMPPWGAQLGNEKIWQVLAYIETLPRTSEPGLGAPDYEAPGP